jgi:predicted dehydrogenase
MRKITMLGTGLIDMFYTMVLHGLRSRDRVVSVYSRTEDRARQFAQEWNIPHWTTTETLSLPLAQFYGARTTETAPFDKFQ